MVPVISTTPFGPKTRLSGLLYATAGTGDAMAELPRNGHCQLPVSAVSAFSGSVDGGESRRGGRLPRVGGGRRRLRPRTCPGRARGPAIGGTAARPRRASGPAIRGTAPGPAGRPPESHLPALPATAWPPESTYTDLYLFWACIRVLIEAPSDLTRDMAGHDTDPPGPPPGGQQ